MCLLQILACFEFERALIQSNRFIDFCLPLIAVQCERTLGQSIYVIRVVVKDLLASSSSLYAALGTP